jgi:hypothetical protein
MTIVYTPLIALFSLFRVVNLSFIMCNPYIIATPSLVIIVSYNIAKLIVLIVSLYLGSYIERLSVKVLSLKDYSMPTHFLYYYYTLYI